jgi:hypothetical protein
MRKQFLQSRKDSFERPSLIRIHDATFYRLNRVARKAQLQLTVIKTRVCRSALHYISDRLWQAVARLFSSATSLRGDPEQAVGTSLRMSHLSASASSKYAVVPHQFQTNKYFSQQRKRRDQGRSCLEFTISKRVRQSTGTIFHAG